MSAPPSTAGRHLARKQASQPVYPVDVSAANGQRTVVHGGLWDGVLNATPDDDIDGPSPVEALLAAVGACFVRNLRSVADSARIGFDRIELHIAADRSDDPPALTAVRLDAELTTSAPIATAARVVELALRYGTITRTVARAVRFEVEASINGTPVEVRDVA